MKREEAAKTLQLSTCGLGAAGGILWGGYLFLLALLPNLGTIYFNVATISMVQTLIPWYTAGFGGAIVGLITGLVCGFVCGFLLAWVYNKVVARHSCKVCAA